MNGGTSLLLGTRKGLLMLEHSAGAWKTVRHAFPGLTVSYSFRDPRSEAIWAALDTGHWGPKLQRSQDGGQTWEEVELPKYPAGAELGDGTPASLSYIWLVAPGGSDQPRRLYLGTEPGGLFISNDGGDHFELVESLWNHPSRKTQWFGGGRPQPGIHSILVDPRDSNHVWVAISVAGVFESWDGGKSWTPRNKGLRADWLPDPTPEVGFDTHLLAANRANPQVMMQQNHVGIYRSEDGGQNWQAAMQENGPARFGFPILMDDGNPDLAWVFPAKSDEQRMAIDEALCVCRTSDGGRSWQTLREGLPQKNCYDYALRHAADRAGKDLVFGTNSGNLFLSEDDGEHWECLGTNYPLIYSARFGG
ncbi:protein containg BNR/Asp-box repeat [Longilinea arvoryzae]|uniref:Protein containg BNR/Asp-box repeat n=1 Tax=Longilinea arvoryzae TaxID=360412 RepID=A0A0S7BDQ0_9CHLR|nr:sialidase family protein [Longilinea arvoryzae]GAP12595.1 protein containg BNR/Asp-box repeat [Longilinea arvoryzae]